jgi:nitronate monooxygenase
MSQIPLIAAGGIVDGRGVAAAVMLGAAGFVMGTRFLAAEETSLPGEYREAIINAVDGGVSTVRSRVFDEIWGPRLWPELYDARCLRTATYADVAAGIPMQEVVRRFYLRLMERQDKDLDVKEAGSVWAGTGVGLVKKIEDAATIIRQVRLEAARRLENGISLGAL